MISVNLDDLADVALYYTTPEPVPLGAVTASPPDIVHRPGPALPVLRLTDVQGNRVDVKIPGVAAAALLRDSGAHARQWHVAQAERSYAADE